MKINKLLPIIAVIFITGCVTSSHNYTPPSVSLSAAENFKEVDKSKEEVWNELVTGLSSQFFVINNMDKSSGFINVSYSGDPQRYVDGGQLDFKVSNLAGPRDYNFPATQANAKYETFVRGVLVTVTRSLNLEGRINVVVSEVGPSKTRVTVHTRYVLTMNEFVVQDVDGQSATVPAQTLTFDTGSEGRTPVGHIFRPTGELENSVLALVK